MDIKRTVLLSTTEMNCSGIITEKYCPDGSDNWLSWKKTCPNQTVTLDCPRTGVTLPYGASVLRICDADGNWEWSRLKGTNKTNFDSCLLPQVRDLYKMCDSFGNNSCSRIGNVTRYIETVGYSISMISLLVALYIFAEYRVLKNNRTKIHKNLFISTSLQVFFRLIRYIDQDYKIIGNITFLDRTCIVLLEYARTTMFMWMFIEGLYLHNMITVTVFQEYSYINWYFYIGWTSPGVITIIWLITMIVNVDTYWTHYYFLHYYWILEGPRSIMILVNLMFLLNIIRVLIVKLRESHTSEIEQVRKAVRAAIFLLPLMGIHNILFLLDYKYDKAWKFALWSYTNYFFASFQGFFVAVLYCFLNGEVQTAIKNSFYLRMSLRNSEYAPCKNFTLISVGQEDQSLPMDDKPRWIHCCKQLDESPEEKEIRSNQETWTRVSRDETNSSLVEERIGEEKM